MPDELAGCPAMQIPNDAFTSRYKIRIYIHLLDAIGDACIYSRRAAMATAADTRAFVIRMQSRPEMQQRRSGKSG